MVAKAETKGSFQIIKKKPGNNTTAQQLLLTGSHIMQASLADDSKSGQVSPRFRDSKEI